MATASGTGAYCGINPTYGFAEQRQRGYRSHRQYGYPPYGYQPYRYQPYGYQSYGYQPY
jgi:hypothetical protein